LGAIAPASSSLAQTIQEVPQLDPSTSIGPALDPPLPFQTVDEVPELDSTYRLGTGDVIDINVFGAEEYSTQAVVLQDGSINLPGAGQVLVRGMTLREAETAIATRYRVFLRQPIVSVIPANLRPVRIAISGEVKRPGSYTVEQSTDNINDNAFDNRFPTLTDAISQAGGITGQADIREVVIRRPVGYGQVQTTRYNLWELIQSGDLGTDIVLQGGDEVFVPTATALTPGEATALASANFAPNTINVYVAGEVERPGQIQVPLNTPLNEVLLNAGGFNPRANRGTVALVRLNPDGTVQQRQITVDLAQSISDDQNPTLQDRDVLVVDRSGLARAGDATDILLSPVTRVLNTILGLQRLFE
jgi:polysaccharide export outer membrane protein